MNYQGNVQLAAPPLAVWDFVLDVDRFASCFPGVEDLRRVDEETFAGTMQAKVGPISSSFAFEARIVDAEAPVRLTARVEGTDSLTKSVMISDISMQIASDGGAGAALAYQSKVNVKGRLGILGDMVLRATGAQVIEEFFNRLRERVEADAAAGA
jgi:carbon monoxide dehydrogenase subunit G